MQQALATTYLMTCPEFLCSKYSFPLLKSSALCFISTTCSLIIPYFRAHLLMFCRRPCRQVCTSLAVTQKMSSARLKKLLQCPCWKQNPDECRDWESSACRPSGSTVPHPFRDVSFFYTGILLFYWGQRSITYAQGSFCRSIRYRTI